MFRSKKGKEGKDLKAEDKKGRFTLKRSKAKKKHGGLEQGQEISDPLGYIPPAAFANTNPPQGHPHVGGDAYAVLPQQGVQARALYEYDPEQEDEIQLKEGDIVAVYERDESGWWTGECRGKYGLFPGAFVELVGAEPGVAFPQYHLDANANASASELEALPSSSSMASLEGPDAEASQEILSYLEEGLHDNDLANGGHTEETSELSHSGELYSSRGSNATSAESLREHHQHHQDDNEGGPASEEMQQPDHDELASAPESEVADGEPEAQMAEVEAEAPEVTPHQEQIDRYRTPSSSSAKVATRLPAAENGQHEAHPTVDAEATMQPPAPEENGGAAGGAVETAAYHGWEQERAEWEQHSREWEHSYDVLNAELEAVKQEKADILQQLDQLRQAHDQQAVSLDAVQKQLEEQKRVNESEQATADSQLLIIQRLEEQLQEAEREKVQAQASTLSAEANAEEIARLHSLLSDEGKQRESAERALEEERKRSAELAEQLRSEQQLRAEAEAKLQQANKEVHERVAKVEDTLLRHLQDAKAQLAAAIQSRPSSRPSSGPSSAYSSPSSSFIAPPNPSSNASNAAPSPAPAAHHHHTPVHQPSATAHGGPIHPPSGVGHHLRPTPPSAAGARPPSVAGGPGAAAPHHQLRPVGAGGVNGPHGMQRPVPPSAGQAAGGAAGASGAARGRGAPPMRGGVAPAVRGRGEPMQRPQIPPGSQKPPLTAQPGVPGTRMVPIGGTARAAVSRPPPGRPRGSTVNPAAAGSSGAPPAIVQ